jgi:hypothetical protein
MSAEFPYKGEFEAEPLTPFERKTLHRKYSKMYGLTPKETDDFLAVEGWETIEPKVEAWRERHGWIATNSPLSRGFVQDAIAKQTQARRSR